MTSSMDSDTTQLLKKKKKKNEIISFAAIEMDLEIIILNEASQKEKDKCHMISLIYGI